MDPIAVPRVTDPSPQPRNRENRQRYLCLVLGDAGASLSALRPTNHENPASNLERLVNEGMAVNELADTSHHELQLMDCLQGYQRVDYWKGYKRYTYPPKRGSVSTLPSDESTCKK